MLRTGAPEGRLLVWGLGQLGVVTSGTHRVGDRESGFPQLASPRIRFTPWPWWAWPWVGPD